MKNWVLPSIKMYKGRISLSLIFGILGVGSGAMLLFLSGYLISKSSLQPENIMIVYVPIVAVRAFSIGRAVFLYIEKLFSHDLVLRMLEKMRTKLYKILEPQALFLKEKYQTGDLLGILSDDIEHLQDLYLRTIFPSVLGIAIYSVIVLTFGAFDLTFALIMVLMLGVLTFLIPFVSYQKLKQQYISNKKQRNTLYQSLTDALFGLTDWQASGRISEFLSYYDHLDQKMVQTEQKTKNWHYLRDSFIQLIIGLTIIGTMIWTGMKTDENILQPTVIAAFTMMMFSVTEALIPISEAVEKLPTYTESIDRIKEVQKEKNTYFLQQKTPQEPEYQQIDLAIQDLNYRYPHQKHFTLKDFSLHIPALEKVALLGRSGEGKSTLLKLISGALVPHSGRIEVNNKKADHSFLSNHVSVLNQKPHLFSTTIANNIRLGKPKATEEEIMNAAKQAKLSPLIRSLPKGIHTPMFEMGSRFSGGERQRIAFARVLLQNKPIIIVDEATIGLDPRHEAELLDAMLSATKDKTLIWITHHLAGVEEMDQVVFLKDGKVYLQGNHETLIAEEPYYQKLYQMDQGR